LQNRHFGYKSICLISVVMVFVSDL